MVVVLFLLTLSEELERRRTWVAPRFVRLFLGPRVDETQSFGKEVLHPVFCVPPGLPYVHSQNRLNGFKPSVGKAPFGGRRLVFRAGRGRAVSEFFGTPFLALVFEAGSRFGDHPVLHVSAGSTHHTFAKFPHHPD